MVNATPNPLANLTVDGQRLVAFMNEAAAYARSNGRDGAIAAYNNRNGSFVRDDLYVFAYDMNGTARALPLQTEMVGMSFYDATDSTSQYCIRAEIEFARKGGGPHLPVVAANPARWGTVVAVATKNRGCQSAVSQSYRTAAATAPTTGPIT